MDKKKIFPFKVKPGSYQEMVKILRFPEVTGREIDNEVCRVTITNHAIDLSLKKEYVGQYKNDHVFQIRLLCNNERDFIVMGSMLEHLKESIMQ